MLDLVAHLIAWCQSCVPDAQSAAPAVGIIGGTAGAIGAIGGLGSGLGSSGADASSATGGDAASAPTGGDASPGDGDTATGVIRRHRAVATVAATQTVFPSRPRRSTIRRADFKCTNRPIRRSFRTIRSTRLRRIHNQFTATAARWTAPTSPATIQRKRTTSIPTARRSGRRPRHRITHPALHHINRSRQTQTPNCVLRCYLTAGAHQGAP